MSKLTKALTAAAGNAGVDNLYVEDVFSTYIYDGNNTTNAIVNGLDLAGEGGMLWTKRRDGSKDNRIWDTERGRAVALISNTTAANGATSTASEDLISFNSNGFTFGANAHYGQNSTSQNFVSWSFRKAEKFFDVVTYTGDGASSRTIAHSLGSVPAFMTVKSSSNISGWRTYHASLGATQYVQLQTTAAAATYNIWNDTTPTDSVFSISTDVNANGVTYVAYLFASDAGGFGDDGDENIIKCGSFTTDGSSDAPLQNIGFEPQWIMTKSATGTADWYITDSMRTMSVSSSRYLIPNNSSAETHNATFAVWVPHAQGFSIDGLGTAGETHIYIAIRRPMKTPETGTEVFAPKTRSGSGAIVTTGAGFTPDVFYNFDRTYGGSNGLFDRLRGRGILQTMSTAVENATSPAIYDLVGFDTMDGVELGGAYNINMTGSGRNFVDYYFKRATGFMDVVIETATQSLANPATEHNLGVVPEFMISKSRDSSSSWFVYHSALGLTKYLDLSSSNAYQSYNVFGTTLTSTQFQYYSQASGESIVNYLFATVAGVSKVGSYTGTGSDLNVDCGFSAGARWVMIKRSDISDGVSNAGDWYVWDSVRGIVAGNDPYLLLNSSAAEVTNTDYIDPLSSGFTVTSSAPNSLNKSGGSYIFLAIA